ncbi:nucleoside recognition protein [Deferribacterales bacterium Es71-Z0220]|jgi:hypothetical protein|uniref:nucleoside recognition protein n=1 Tax=Deferrivibrio essentukiensis TaxID=2880922 RepID=UPI001F61BEE4|nr:nucleoside recognition protein [Deferrivibrio essentukiensis]MBZ4672035.1 hypothetical protein [Deferribacteraceae bacterium]MCB4205035.1 nucleoside recognition protein [Deferrivibrio essentukiensis]
MDITIFEPLKNALYLCVKLTGIIVMLMIVYEFYENSKLYKLSQDILNKPFSFIGIKSNASITMVVGLVLGIAYGAGILIKNAMSGNMSQKEIILTSIFLSVCHAVFEDTLLFVAVGANGFIIIGIRIVLAFIIILFLNKYFSKSETV